MTEVILWTLHLIKKLLNYLIAGLSKDGLLVI